MAELGQHPTTRLIVAFSIGLLLSYCSYQWVTDSERPQRRAEEEAVVQASRDILRETIGVGNLEISDALDRVREAGKVYLYPSGNGWELSGHYRRVGEADWHDYLMALDGDVKLISLMVNDNDPDLKALAATDPKLSTSH